MSESFEGDVASAAMPPASGLAPFFLADHVVLDALNTEAMLDSGPHDFWSRDAEVWAWLAQAGLLNAPETVLNALSEGDLLSAARELRAAIRALVHARDAGEQLPELELAQLNRVLAAANSHWVLAGDLHLTQHYVGNTAYRVLGPLAEAAARLLVEGDFSLIRKCENPACVLWFYDRTKAHRRRWCSMAVCGNRHKVAAFRQRHAK